MQRKGNAMRALNRRVLALETTAKPMAGYSQEDDEAQCIASAERLEKAYAEHSARNEPDPTPEERARDEQELKELVRRLRAEDS